MSYTEIATKVRNAILATEGDLEHRCGLASNLVMRLIEGGTIADGTYDFNHQHFFVLVDTEDGLLVIDPTAEQFGHDGVYVGPLTEEYAIGRLLGESAVDSGCDDEATWAQVVA